MPDCAEQSQLFDLLAEDRRPNVYAGELEVRPPLAPTIQPGNGCVGGHDLLNDRL
jgi:hypothetical protein